MSKALIDTSVWITFFRGRDVEVTSRVAQLISRAQAVLTGMVLVELLQGAANDGEVGKILGLLEPVERVEPSSQTWEAAGRLAYGLRRKGLTTSTVDIFLAALAIENDLPFFSHDRHFELIQKHSDLQLLK